MSVPPTYALHQLDSGYNTPDGNQCPTMETDSVYMPDYGGPSSSNSDPAQPRSTVATPGPMRRFQQNYGSSTAYQSQSAADYCNSWMQNHHSDYPEYSSRAPSHMSLASSVSRISVDTVLTVVTEIPSNELAHDPVASISPYVENTDPMLYQRMNDYIAEMTAALGTNDLSAKRRALSELYSHSKYLMYVTDVARLQLLIGQLFHNICQLSAVPELVNRALSIVYEMSRRQNCTRAIHDVVRYYEGRPIHILCDLLNPSAKYCNYVMSILYALFTQRDHGRCYRNCARHVGVVQKLLTIAATDNLLHRYIALDNIRLLLAGRSDLKIYFKNNAGIEVCLNIMGREVDERLLFATVSVICGLLAGQDSAPAVDLFVKCRGVQTLAKLLDHGSPRLLRKIMNCLCYVSDSTLLVHQNLDVALLRTVQILGSVDLELIHEATGFLMNVTGRNPAAKIFLHDNDAIRNLTSLASVLCQSLTTPMSPAEKKNRHGIVENSLRALVNLTQKYEHKPYLVSACQQLLVAKGDIRPLQWLLNLLAYSSKDLVELQYRAIKILLRIIEHVDASCETFVNVFSSGENGRNFPSAIVGLLVHSADSLSNEIDAKEKYRNLTSLLLRLMSQLLRNTTLFRDFAHLSRRYRNPLVLMEKFKDLDLELAMMTIVCQLSADAELAVFWSCDTTSVNILRLCLQSSAPQLQQLAQTANSRIHHAAMYAVQLQR